MLNNSVSCKYSFNVKKIVPFQTIQFSVSTQFEYQNIFILSNSI